MGRLLLTHWPHVLPLVAAVAVLIYLLRTKSPAKVGPAASPRPAPAARQRPGRRGLALVVPVLAAMATGVVVYGMRLSAVSPAHGAVWVHSGLGVLVVLLTAYKLAAVPRGSVMALRFSAAGLARLGSLMAVLLLVPLLLTGIVLALDPPPGDAAVGGTPFLMYLHLIAGVWWSALMVWHLKRYLVAALHAAPPRKRFELPSAGYRRAKPSS